MREGKKKFENEIIRERKEKLQEEVLKKQLGKTKKINFFFNIG